MRKRLSQFGKASEFHEKRRAGIRVVVKRKVQIDSVLRSPSTSSGILVTRPMTTLGVGCIWRFDEPSICSLMDSSFTRRANSFNFPPRESQTPYCSKNQFQRRQPSLPAYLFAAVEEERIIEVEEVVSI
jgi:hypothetical protein